jgi:CheY-like chemotaxis protein
MHQMFDVPVVFVTAYSDKETVERIHEVVPGAPVLAKPVFPERLAKAVADVSRAAA